MHVQILLTQHLLAVAARFLLSATSVVEAAIQPYLSPHPAPTGKTRDNSDLYGCSACRSKNCPRERQRNFGSAANCPRPAVRSRRNSQVRTAYSLPEYSTIAKQTTAAIPVISACFIVRFPPLIFIMLNFPARCRKRDVGSCPPSGHHRQDKAAALRWLNPAAISAEVSCNAMAYLAMA